MVYLPISPILINIVLIDLMVNNCVNGTISFKSNNILSNASTTEEFQQQQQHKENTNNKASVISDMTSFTLNNDRENTSTSLSLLNQRMECLEKSIGSEFNNLNNHIKTLNNNFKSNFIKI